jgi:subtilisin family serine protease
VVTGIYQAPGIAAKSPRLLSLSGEAARAFALPSNTHLESSATPTSRRLTREGVSLVVWTSGLQGVSILSTKMGDGTQVLFGTSMASPHIAWAAALFLSSNPVSTPAQIEKVIIEKVIKDNAVNTGTQSKEGRAIIRLNVGGF